MIYFPAGEVSKTLGGSERNKSLLKQQRRLLEKKLIENLHYLPQERCENSNRSEVIVFLTNIRIDDTYDIDTK